MTVWASLAGGFVGSLAMVLGFDAGVSARATRLDIPLLLGSTLFERRITSQAVGYLLHVGLGIGFSAAYAGAGVDGWGEGALAGLVHGAAAATVLFPVLLPLAHPRMALHGGEGRALLEAPGALALAYGRWTPVLLVALHVAYGTIVGGFAGWRA